ncbi:MAG TPA: hypothetical protein VLA79_06500 [Polyangia bacterium]|nr:hypothetical protein [Polyangia bacterium]
MSYLYGDSTPSQLEVNFIEFLRDAVECCVQVLLADQRIAEGEAHTRALETATAAEIDRLQKMGALVPKALEAAPVGDPASATARCVAEIVRSAAALVRSASEEESANLQAAITRRDAEAAIERAVFTRALETLLIKHDLPEMTSDTSLALVGGARYACRLRVSTGFGLDALLELEVPAGHLLERVVRVDRLAERLEVQVPEMAGWLHKEIKLRTQHLEKHHLSAFSSGRGGSTLHLRLAPDGTGAGYDVTFPDEVAPIRLVRVDEQQKREESFDLQEVDAPKLTALRDKIGAAVSELGRHRTKIVEAKLDGESLQSHAKPTLLVDRLIAVLVPETQEIAARSQSRSELVLRRSLAGDRREEIFLSRQDLKLKLEPLNDRNRALFDALLVEGGALAPSREPPPAPPPRGEMARPSAPVASTSPSRLPTPLYGVPPLSALPKATAGSEPRPPERPSATALDRPPPVAATGEIGGAPEEQRSERSGPVAGS